MDAKKIIFSVMILIGISSLFAWKKMFQYEEKNLYNEKEYITRAEKMMKDGKSDEAITLYKKALDLNPDNFDAHLSLGIQHFKRQEYLEAEKRFKKALALHPDSASLCFALGNILREQGKVYEAIDFFKRAIELRSNFINAHQNLSYAYRAIGELQKGWQVRNLATKLRIKAGTGSRLYKEWDGLSLKGKTLLIRDEVGLGEMFCWIRYAKHFKEQEGTRIVVESRSPLIPLLKLCPYVDEVVLKGSKVPPFDAQSYVSSLVRLSNASIETLPADIPYLYADDALVQYWKDKLSDQKEFKIGICWQSQVYKDKTGRVIKNKRAMPLSAFYPLGALKNVKLYSLQKMIGEAQLKDLPDGFVVHDFGEDFDNSHGRFMDTAAVMKHLDVVLTVDTSIADLAGGLGVDVWMMLPHVPDWRWFLERSDSPLYPTMRIFRQPKPGDWASVMKEVVAELPAFLAKHKKD